MVNVWWNDVLLCSASVSRLQISYFSFTLFPFSHFILHVLLSMQTYTSLFLKTFLYKHSDFLSAFWSCINNIIHDISSYRKLTHTGTFSWRCATPQAGFRPKQNTCTFECGRERSRDVTSDWSRASPLTFTGNDASLCYSADVTSEETSSATKQALYASKSWTKKKRMKN